MMPRIPTDRPAELVALLAIASAVYGWLSERGVPDLIAAPIGLIAGTVPLAVSWLRDGRPEPGDPGDDQVDGPPPAPADPIHEQAQLEHQ